MHIFYSLLIFALLGIFSGAEEHSNDLEVERVKRVTVEDPDVDFASSNDDRPARPRQAPTRNRNNKQSVGAQVSGSPAALVLPPYFDASIPAFDKTKKSCLLYLEGITILVINKKTIGSGQAAYTLPLVLANTTDSYGYEDGYVVCPSNFTTGTPFSFKIDYQIKDKHEYKPESSVLMSVSSGFTLTLNFVSNTGFDLTSATITGLTINKGDSGSFLQNDVQVSGDATNVYGTKMSDGTKMLDGVNMRAYFGYNYACSATPALLFNVTDTNVLVGIILNNFQVQGFGVDVDTGSKIPYFGSKTADCMPTFNQGTWMGIIVTLILVSVLAFAFLMLNSVQTMDRFDDPKQKQIVINFKE